jgi:3-hydroxymyristoyl/3-hydroxydecanoyl-(acyl carrier protein) dehydratase
MNLKNELRGNYQVKRIDERNFTVDLSLPSALTFFQGHFPDLPVLPAVAFVDISVFFLRECFPQLNLELRAIPSLKLKKVLPPETHLQLSLQKSSENRYEVKWQDYALIIVDFVVQQPSRQAHTHH